MAPFKSAQVQLAVHRSLPLQKFVSLGEFVFAVSPQGQVHVGRITHNADFLFGFDRRHLFFYGRASGRFRDSPLPDHAANAG